MSHPDFSVLMSVYNGEEPKFLRESILSLRAQFLKASEIVLVIDGPISNDLKNVIDEWSVELNIKVLPIDENVGLSKALNYGLNFCSNELIARMDSDDICFPERFLKQINFMVSNENIDIVGSFCEDFSVVGSPSRVRKVPTQHSSILKNIWACPFIHPSVVLEKVK